MGPHAQPGGIDPPPRVGLGRARGEKILLRSIFERRLPMEPSYAYENFCDMYEAYQALGGHGMTVKMKKEMDARKLGDRRKVNWPTNE